MADPGARAREEAELFARLCRLGPARRAAELSRVADEDPELAARLGELLDNDPGAPTEDACLDEGLRDSIPGFELRREIGRGSSGVVYAALDLELQRMVAVKVFDPVESTLSDSDEALRRFEREPLLLTRIEHSGLAPIHARGRDTAGRPYFVMRLIEGVDLHALLKALPATPSRADLLELVECLARVCAVLESAHRIGVVHRDLKPSHVRVEERGDVVVIDWGLASLCWVPPDATEVEQAIGNELEWSRLTQVDRVLGNASYMAPEQALRSGLPTTPRVDVWALGAILYQALFGRPAVPLDEGEPLGAEELLRRVREARPRVEVEGLEPDVQSLGRVVERALQRDPDARFASAGELGASLRGWLRGTAPVAVEPARRRGWVGFAVPAAALLVGIALGARSVSGRVTNGGLPVREEGNRYSIYGQLINAGALVWGGDGPIDKLLLRNTLDFSPSRPEHVGPIWLTLFEAACAGPDEDSSRSAYSAYALQACRSLETGTLEERELLDLLAPALFWSTLDLCMEEEVDRLEPALGRIRELDKMWSSVSAIPIRLLAERASHKGNFERARELIAELINGDGAEMHTRFRIEMLRHRGCIELEAGLPAAARPDLELAQGLGRVHLLEHDQLRFDVDQQVAWMEFMAGNAESAFEQLSELFERIEIMNGLSWYRRGRLEELTGDVCLELARWVEAADHYSRGERAITWSIGAEFAAANRCRAGRMRALAMSSRLDEAIAIGRSALRNKAQRYENGKLAQQMVRLRLLECL